MLRFIMMLFVFSVCFVYRLITFPRDIWNIWVLRKHNKILKQHTGSAAAPVEHNRIAVIAIFPSDESIPFTQNLLAGLLKNHFYVVALSNRTLSLSQHQALSPYYHVLIERPNIGRDFGSYQYGIKWLSKRGMLEKADWLMLANDSLYYPKNIQNIIADMLEKGHPWQALFENFDERHYHVQSFFLLFNRKVFLSHTFQTFWKKYFPSSTRPHSIDKGEVGISQALRRGNYMPKAYYTSSYVTNYLKKITAKETIDNMPVSGMLFDLYFNEMYTHLSNKSLPVYCRKAIYSLERMMNYLSPVGPAGLAISNALHAPLKRDLFYRRIFDLFQILNYAGGFSPDELAAMENDLRNRNPIGKRSIFKRALLSRGYL